MCNCPDPALCAELKTHIAGRLWEIWNGINIDPEKAEKYRAMWRREAKGLPALQNKPRIDKGKKPES